MSEWQPIETAPKSGELFVATGWDDGDTDSMRHYVVVFYDSDAEHVVDGNLEAGGFVASEELSDNVVYTFLTHWIPLPPLNGSKKNNP